MLSLLTLLDDIATTLDDVAAMTKVALHKTSALMSDDLAVNAGVIDGVNPDKELPMVKEIFLGSLINKVICIAGILILNALYPPLITVILVIGGAYLSFEGVHKIFEKAYFWIKKQELHPHKGKELTPKQRVKGAIRTDLILSIEIIVIAKGQVTGSFLTQLLTLAIVGLCASIIIYGLVALIVKVDDFGLYLVKRGRKSLGMMFVRSMPNIMKLLGIVGTLAMLLVGGGIFTHTFHIEIFKPVLLLNLSIGFLVGAALTTIFETFYFFFARSS
ncbi:MAG: DUF808 domain-containing protein [Halobacteriovoraceae bacterium]|nr:DUF808 domain-containing protein [Halobacteriovoraceae bacterium]